MATRWPYLLKQLEDFGWDADKIARAIGQTPVKVRAYRRGYVTPDRVTGLEIDKLVSCIRRRLMPPGAVPPRIVVDAHVAPEPAERVHPERGVYREELAPADEVWFKLVTSRGRVGTVHLPAELGDESLLDNLWLRLEARDPVRKLQAV